MSHGIGLTTDEIHLAFSSDELSARFPPILSPSACAKMLGESINTLYFWLGQGRLFGTHRRRGKHQFIWRDRAVQIFFGEQGRHSASRTRKIGSGIGLSDDEINTAFSRINDQFSPILSPEQLASLLGLSRSTIYFWIEKGRLDEAAVKRGKRQRIWRNRAVAALFNGPEWIISNEQ